MIEVAASLWVSARSPTARDCHPIARRRSPAALGHHRRTFRCGGWVLARAGCRTRSGNGNGGRGAHHGGEFRAGRRRVDRVCDLVIVHAESAEAGAPPSVEWNNVDAGRDWHYHRRRHPSSYPMTSPRSAWLSCQELRGVRSTTTCSRRSRSFECAPQRSASASTVACSVATLSALRMLSELARRGHRPGVRRRRSMG